MPREQGRSTEWDPLLIVAQIVSFQAWHYLVFGLVLPPVLMMFCEPLSLRYEGGPWNVGMVMDWREMAGRPTVHGLHGASHRGWVPFDNHDGSTSDNAPRTEGIDPMRGWVIAVLWVAMAPLDSWFIYHFVRRPKLVLDFTLTMLFNHIILTTYYSAALPSSLFFWATMCVGGAATTILGEKACVRRELQEGIAIQNPDESEQLQEDIEMGRLRNE